VATKTATRKPAKRSPKADAPKVDAYQVITDRIIELLESGTAPWRKPWSARAGAGSLPTSMSTRRPYRGINVMILHVESMIRGFSSNWWGTYKQISERGGQVRQGEKGTQIVLWRPLMVADKLDPSKMKKIMMMRLYTVFNADQADGELGLPVPAPRTPAERIEACETVVAEYFARPGAPSLRHGGAGAFYYPGPDAVEVPDAEEFTEIGEYYTSIFHEMTHSTGHSSRLDREGIGGHTHYGDARYSKEELVAELGASFLAGRTGIDTVTEENSAAYLRSWVGALKGDKKLVVQAAQAAQKAVDLILGEVAETEAAVAA
jgi:antirestriction protein ArdC